MSHKHIKGDFFIPCIDKCILMCYVCIRLKIGGNYGHFRIFLLVVLLILGILALALSEGDAIMISIGIVFILIAIALSAFMGFNSGVKDEQIDAITGIIKYEKVIHDNETVTWEWIEEEK